jgi:hypothetical protein
MTTKRQKTGEAGPLASEGTNGSASAALPIVRVGYKGSDKSMAVSVVGEWRRGEVEMVMSTSSGPKDYIKNLMCAALEQTPDVDTIRMVIGEYKQSVPFCLMGVNGRWFDCSAKEVVWS